MAILTHCSSQFAKHFFNTVLFWVVMSSGSVSRYQCLLAHVASVFEVNMQTSSSSETLVFTHKTTQYHNIKNYNINDDHGESFSTYLLFTPSLPPALNHQFRDHHNKSRASVHFNSKSKSYTPILQCGLLSWSSQMKTSTSVCYICLLCV
jgi:hypothetical protein